MSSILPLFKHLFASKLNKDDREISWIFEVPGVDGTFGLLSPTLEYWSQIIYILLMSTIVNVAVGSIVYLYLLPNRGTPTAYFLGFGVCIPACLAFPYFLLDFLEPGNVSVKMACGLVSTTMPFKISEAMFGTSPPGVEFSLQNYALGHCSSLVECEWDGPTHQRVKITSRELRINLNRIIWHIVFVCALISYLLAYDYKPFASNVVLDDFHFTWDLFQPGHLANNYLLALTTLFSLSTTFNMFAFQHNVAGFKTPDLFNNPIFMSASLRDLWSNRWNKAIQRPLKRGVFQPVQKHYPAWVAVGCTFLVSRLLHEMTWNQMFYHKDDGSGQEPRFTPTVFKQIAFFGYNGVLMLLEGHFEQRFTMFQSMYQQYPLLRPLVSTLVLLPVLPVVHWFGGDWAIGGLFHDFAIGLPRFVKLN